MRYNVKELNPEYDFEINGMSYIGKPIDGTCLFVTGKIKNMISNLEGHRQCLVFVDKSMKIPKELKRENCFFASDDPHYEYGVFSLKMREIEKKEKSKRSYRLTPEGYYIGENVTIGESVTIEPGCLIDHDVVIGKNSFIGFGSVVRNAHIGENFNCYEHSVIGTESFNLGESENYTFRIPSFGKVIIGNYVELGSHVVIERGFNSDTRLKDCVNIDSGVILGHDVVIYEGTIITCGACVAGRVEVGRDTYIGMNATIKQRIVVGENAMIGMGASVITNVKPQATVFGNPAKKMGI